MYPQGKPCYDENDTDKQAEDINVESEPEPAGTRCPYCSLITSKTLEQHWMECDMKIRFNCVVCSYGRQWKHILVNDLEQFNHITEHPNFN